MREISEILEDIEKIYKPYKSLEKVKKSYREALEHHFNVITDETEEDKLLMLGMLFRYKPDPTYKWKKEELNDELEAIGRIHEAKKIDKHIAKFLEVISIDKEGNSMYDEDDHPITEPISVFAYPCEQYARPYPKRGKKEEVERENRKYESLTEDKKQENVEDVLTQYKIIKLDYDSLDNEYKALRKELLEAMLKENTVKVASSIGNFQVMKNDPEYNYLAMFGREFVKLLQYSVRFKEGKFEFYDHFSKESILTDESEFVLDYHQFQFTDEGLFVDGILLTPSSKEQIINMFKQAEVEDAEFQLSAVTIIPSETLFRQLPISSGKIETLINKSYLHPSIMDNYRYIANPDSMKHSFEVIEETSHNKRIELFLDRNMRRAQKLRYMQDNAKDFLKNQYSIRMRDNKIEVKNHLTNEVIQSDENQFTFGDHQLRFTEEGIYFDNELVSTVSLDMLKNVSKELSDEDEGFILNVQTMTTTVPDLASDMLGMAINS